MFLAVQKDYKNWQLVEVRTEGIFIVNDNVTESQAVLWANTYNTLDNLR